MRHMLHVCHEHHDKEQGAAHGQAHHDSDELEHRPVQYHMRIAIRRTNRQTTGQSRQAAMHSRIPKKRLRRAGAKATWLRLRHKEVKIVSPAWALGNTKSGHGDLSCPLLVCRIRRLTASGLRSPWNPRTIPSRSAEAWMWTCLVGPQSTSRYPSVPDP